MAESKEEALRYNDNKVRYDLLEPYAIEQLAKVFTKGAEKYAPFNWMKGMPWSKMLASLKRHIAAFEKGEDFDFDPNCKDCKAGNCKNHTGLHHMAHAMWNCAGLVTYSKYHPELDDRMHTYLKPKRYALDIDDVLADFVPAWTELHGQDIPINWFFDKDIATKFDVMRQAGNLDEFYLNLPVKTKPEDIPFEPVVYVTSRPVSSDISREWLIKNGFPDVPVETSTPQMSKVDILKKYNVDIMVDDSYPNYEAINKAGVCCFLFDAAHNRRYNVGYRRIKSLMDLKI